MSGWQATQDGGDVGASADQRGVSRWLPDHSITLMGDTASSVLEVGLHAKAKPLTLVTTGRLAALEQVLQDPHTVWQNLTLDWYGQGERTLEICTGTALWYRYGYDPLPIRSRADA